MFESYLRASKLISPPLVEISAIATNSFQGQGHWSNPEMESSMLEADVNSGEGIADEPSFLPAPEQTSLLQEEQQEERLDELRWQPMLGLFGPGIAAQFIWAVTTDGIETYEHRETYRFLHIDSITGECLNQQCEVISSESALQHALKPRNAPVAEPAEEVAWVDAVEFFAEAAQPEVPAIEPQINGFMRKLEVADVSAGRITLAAPLYQTDTFIVQEEMLAPTRQSWLSKALSWSNPLSSKAQDGSDTQGYNSQDLDFANFTRRTSVL